MKKIALAFLLLAVSFQSFSQKKDFNFSSDIDSLLTVYPKGFAVYLSAFWCGPCLGKSKAIYNYFRTKEDSIPLIFVYDDHKFSEERGQQILGDCFTKSQNLLIDTRYYTAKGLVQINPQMKAIKNIITLLKGRKLKKGNLDDLYFGQLLFFDPAKEVSLLHFEYGKKITNEQLVAFLHE